MLYTIVPEEIVWQERTDTCGAERLLPFGGAIVAVRRGTDGSARIERLIATDPSLFLDPRLMPGSPPPR